MALAVLALGAWLGIRGWQAKGELESLQALAAPLSDAVVAGDVDAIADVVTDAHGHAARAAELTTDPVWRAAELIPGVGPNAAAVRVVSETARDVTDAAGDVLAVLRSSGGRARSSGVDLAQLAALEAPLARVASAVTKGTTQLGAIPTDGLIAPVGSAVTRLRDVFDTGEPVLTQAAGGVGVLPPLLGADGPRRILVMVQNSSEVRTAGGITGSFIELTATDGDLTITGNADSSMFGRAAESPVPLPADLTALYGADVGRYVMNTTITPDFTLSSRLASSWWQSSGHTAPDAVVSVDPLVLAALLRVTGPITLTDGTVVDSTTVVPEVLIRPYMELDQAGQTRIQDDLVQRLFSALLATPVDPLTWVTALREPVTEGRISMWSAHPDEAAALADSPFGGTLARFRDAGPDAVGVYFNDATTGKMDGFLEVGISPAVQVCRADGVADVAISVALTSTAPDAARGYPPFMAGGLNPSAAGDITTDVTVTVPSGWFFGGVQVDGSAALSTDVADGEYPASLTRVTLAPGQSKTVVFRFAADADGRAPEPAIVHTPLMNPVNVAATEPSACS